jgi:two-component system response regulator ResD
MGRARVLIVDDEPMVRDVLSRYLRGEGFVVDTAGDGEEAMSAVLRTTPDLVLLDLMLPKVDGLEVLRRVRELGQPGVILLTAKGEETDRVVGLELGADDYVTKPFSPREVVARVRAVLRRGAPPARAEPADVLSFGELEVDGPRRAARRLGEELPLTRKEFDLLWLLCTNPGTTFTRAQLLAEVWDFAWDGDSATVTVHIRRLRQKLEDDPSAPRHLLTVWGVGYRFEP